MRDAILRQQKDRWLQPVATRGFVSIHPNVVSLAALGVGLLAGVAIANQLYWVGLILWLVNRVLDGLDGVVARIHHKQSDFGGYLDLFLDFLVYLAVPISVVISVPTTLNLWALVALFSSYYLNTMSWMGLSALLEKRRLQSSQRLTSLEMPTGLIEGAETIVFYALFCLLPSYTAWLFGLMALLVLVTIGQRLIWVYRQLH
jgi:phosphatidylglycerophosphate synthase